MSQEYQIVFTTNAEEILKLMQQMDQLGSKMGKGYNVKFNTNGISTATRQITQMESAGKRVETMFSRIGSGMQKVGGAMQSLGNAFGGKIVGTVKTMGTAFATMGLYSAAQGTVERYDTMRMFPKMMEHLGYSAEEATASVKKLEDAVIGLPTGLDEIVDSAKQLIPLTGDLQKGTDLAIAVNNAFLAGGADANAVRFGQRQIKDLLAKGTLRSQEWDSLFTSLGSGLGVIAEEMGYSSKATKGLSKINDELAFAQKKLKSAEDKQKKYAVEGGTAKAINDNANAVKAWREEVERLEQKQDKSLGSFRSALKSNKLDALEFLDALIKVGTGEGELAKRADDYKDTISAAARNIKNAMQKLGAAGLDALDNVLTEKTGKGIPGTIREISDSIKQNLVPALQGWTSDNGDKIVGFFDKLKNYDWIGLVSKVGKGLAQYYNLMTTFFTKISPKVIAFMSVWAGPIGRMLSTVGGIVKGMGGIVGKVVDIFSKGRTAKTVATAVQGAEGVAKIGFNFANAFKGLGLTAGWTGEIALIGGVIAEYAKIFEMIGNIDLGPNFKKNIGEIATFAGYASTIATGLTALFTALTTIPGLAGAIGIGELLSGGYIALIGEIGLVIQTYAKTISDIASMNIPDEGKMAKLGASLKTLKTDVIDNIPTVKQKNVSSMDNLNEIVDSVKGIATSLKDIKSVGLLGDMSKKTANIVEAATATYKALPEKKVPQKYADSAANLESIMGSVMNIAESMVNMKKKLTFLTQEGKSGEQRYKVIATELKAIIGKDGIGGILSQFAADKTYDADSWGVIESNLKSFDTATGYVASIVEKVFNAKEQIKKITTKVKGAEDGENPYTSVTATRLQAVMQGILDVFKMPGLDLKTFENERAMGNLERWSKASSSIATIVESFSNVAKMARQLAPYVQRGVPDSLFDEVVRFKTGKSSPIQNLKDRIIQILKAMKGISDTISSDDFEIDTSGDMEAKVTALSDMIGMIPEMVTTLQGIDLKGLEFEDESFTLGDNIGKIINGLSSAFSSIVDADYGDLGENAEALNSAVNQLTGESGIITALQGVQDKIAGLGVAEGVWPAGEALKTAIQTLMGIFPQNFGETMAGGDLLGGVASNLSAIVGQLEQLAANAEAAATNLQSAAKGVDKLGQSAAEHTGEIEDVAEATGKLKSAVSGIGSSGNRAAGGVDALGGAASRQVDNLYSAARAAGALAAAINSIPSSKTISINTVGNSTSGGIHTAGGTIMRASGGPVNGPGGIDNVPAWLTNGEFVMRKSAHSKFGTAFMNRINNLDVEGAMRALSLRAGSGIRSRANVTNNYTRDNHANVTFNVQRATQRYSQRIASRWARALS